jgi:hypothetical protein
VGSGGSLDAAYSLKGDVPAGTYRVICDAIIIRSVDVTFTLIHRRGGTDTELATWMHHFDPLPGGIYDAQPYEIDQDAPAIDFQDGDEFVFRYAGANTMSSMAFIPNGDGALAKGRIPNITLPQ